MGKLRHWVLIRHEAVSARCRCEISQFYFIPMDDEITAVKLLWSLVPFEMSHSTWHEYRSWHVWHGARPVPCWAGRCRILHETLDKTRCLYLRGWILPPLTSLKPRSYETPPQNCRLLKFWSPPLQRSIPCLERGVKATSDCRHSELGNKPTQSYMPGGAPLQDNWGQDSHLFL